MKPWLLLLATLSLLLATGDASAQGRCRCNNGCHSYPGQCVNGSGSCDQGYAPFCDTRPTTDCRTGWVSCAGACTCIRVSSPDGGVAPDAPVVSDVPPGADVPRADVSPGADAPPATDAPRADVPLGVDVPAGADVPPGMDVPRADATPGADVPPGADAPPGMDAAPGVDATPGDAPVASDGPCACDGGICYFGVCVRDRCEYQRELGFVCAIEGRRCVLQEGEAWCVPGCLGVTCTEATFCEPETGNCVRDECATIRCPLGSVCALNRCVAAASDGGAAGDGGRPVTGVEDGGCGCRARPAGGGRLPVLAALGLLCATRRRRRNTA